MANEPAPPVLLGDHIGLFLEENETAAAARQKLRGTLVATARAAGWIDRQLSPLTADVRYQPVAAGPEQKDKAVPVATILSIITTILSTLNTWWPSIQATLQNLFPQPTPTPPSTPGTHATVAAPFPAGTVMNPTAAPVQ